MKSYIGKFIGKRKIRDIVESSDKSYLGSEKYDIIFEDNSNATYPKWMIEETSTDSEIIETQLRDKRVNPTLEKIIAILAEAELTQDEIIYAIQTRLPNILGSNMDKAQEVLFGKPYYETTLYDIEKIINPRK